MRGASVDALTNSVDIRSKMQQIVGTKGVREQSVRVSRFNGPTDELAHNSVHEKGLGNDLEQLSVSGPTKHSVSNHEQNSIRKSLHGVTIDPKSKPEEDDQQAGAGEKLGKDVQLNLQNLVQIEDKLSALSGCLKKNNISNISQLCSDWWEYTDEDDYTINKFIKAYRDEKARREIKQQMALEILSIAIVNYYY